MAYPYGDILFTEAVQQFQTAAGSREGYANMMRNPDRSQGGRDIGPDEKAFIEARDGFYQASISSSGWPYVQFRGGPRGFAQVTGARTIAWADLRGNRQYISAGNISQEDRVALFMMDYPNKARLKVLGRAKILSAAEAPDLLERLMLPEIRGHAERIIEITLEAFDWNCPAHIPQRFTVEELQPHLGPLQDHIAKLEEENARLKSQLAPESE